MEQETDTQPDPGRVLPPDAVSSSNMTNFGAQHRPRSTVQHRQHPYIIPGRKPSTQKLRRVPENSSLGTDTRVDRPLAADQQRFIGTLEPFPLTTSNVAPSTQLITSILIPDLTSLITRCSPDPIAGGTYGNIYKCIYHGPEGDAEVAVKAIRQQFFSAEIFRRELGIWKRLWHSNILKFMGTTSDFGPSVALVAPWMTNGTLTSFLDRNNETLELHDRLLLLRDIAAGLNYLHTFSLTEDGHTDLNPIVHGDLTGTNVLIDDDRKAYLADFGLSGTFKKSTGMTYLANMTCHPGAVRWAAPELLSGEEPATTQSDMYSFGSIMLQVLTGNVPWCHLTRDLLITIQVVIERKIHPRPHEVSVTDRHWNFMTRCWSMSFTDRPPAKEAVQFVDSALHLSTNPQSPTLSISSDERHLGIARNDYLRGNTDARLSVMQDIDSPPQGHFPQDNMFSDLMQSGNSPVFMATMTSSTPSHYTASDFQPYVPQMNMNVEQRLGAMSYSTNKTNAAVPLPQQALPQKLSTEEPDDHDMAELRDLKKVEAMKIIQFHLLNFMRNSAYCLPASLRPTLVQRTIQHESVIDHIIYPELRDRIILLRGQFSLVDCVFDYQKAIKVHGDDVLAQHNWELAEWWLRKYGYLVDKATLNVCNRWRRERGEPDIAI